VGPKGFQLFSSNIITIVEDIYIFLSVISDHNYIKVFKLLTHLSIKTYLAILPKGLYYYNLLLLKGPFCFKVMAFYKVSVEFLFKLL